MTTETIATYDFAEHAWGFGDFIVEHVHTLPADEIIVYVEDEEGRGAKSARLERQTLTDGSTVVNLVIAFED